MRPLSILLLGIVPGLLLPSGTSAQEPVREVEEVSPSDARRIADFLNDAETAVFSGGSRIPAGSRVDGDVGVLGGELVLAGEITGDLMVVNGDLEVLPGGRVGGDVTVVDGRLDVAPDARVAGRVTLYRARFEYVRRGDRIVPREREESRLTRFTSPLGPGNSSFTVRAGTNYNRTEGLPVLFGPAFRTTGSNPTRLELLGIYRTGRGVGSDDMGYRVRAEQALGGHRELLVGLDLHSHVSGIETWGLSDLESSLSTFVVHQDYRDYFDAEGWSAWLSWDPTGTPITLRASFDAEEHRYAPISSPWSLKDNDEPWRPQPIVAEGELRSVATAFVLDTRNSVEDPSGGWWVRADTRMGVGGALRAPALLEPAPGADVPIPEREVSTSFVTGFVDARTYLRVTPSSTLGLRALAGGSLDGERIPAQYQRALGGEGSLPGYGLFAGDCGARDRVVLGPVRDVDGEQERDPVFPRYGCDRIALFQIEYRSHLFVDWSVGPDETAEGHWVPRIDLSPGWSVIADAGRGWWLGDRQGSVFPGRDTETFVDVGAGFLLGDLGIYWALPLRGEGRSPNFFLRLQRRF